MSLILGIDTGGTYTDAVLVTENKEITATAKSFTTHDDLTKGINRCIDLLEQVQYSAIEEVHISTTLAVNSILEGRFERIGLLQLDKTIETTLPANYTTTVRSPSFQMQKFAYEKNPLVILEIEKTFSGNVDYVVVTAPGGKSAAQREHRMAEAIRRNVDIKVFCVTDYCDAEDYSERTLFAMLTLYLMPVIDGWVKSVELMMRKKGIRAELKIMNAMGHLISCEEARKNPLSTLFSGFAASVAGGLGLTDLRDFLLVDMGGTSTDITRIINRQFREVKEQVKVDKFLIREKTMDVQTFGIGGDSLIKLTQAGRIIAGPQKAIPICVMSRKYPYLIGELESCKRPDGYEMLTVQDVDCFIGVKQYRHDDLTKLEAEIVAYLIENPHNVFVIAEHFKQDPDALHLDKLIRKGAVRLISVTPTDVLHAERTCTKWDIKGADTAIHHMAEQLSCTKQECITTIKEAVFERLIRGCMQSIANFEKEQFDFDESRGADFMLKRFYGDEDSMFEMQFEIDKPIVALGAPSGAWLRQVAKTLNTDVIIPLHGEVANAFGAAIAE